MTRLLISKEMSVRRFSPFGYVLDGLRRDTFSTAVRSAVTARLSNCHSPTFIAPQSSRTILSCSIVLVPTLITHNIRRTGVIRGVYSCVLQRSLGPEGNAMDNDRIPSPPLKKSDRY